MIIVDKRYLFILLFLPFFTWAVQDCQQSTMSSGCPILVQASIQSGCHITSSDAVNFGHLMFGNYASLTKSTVTTSLSANALITLQCTPNIALAMSIDNGLHYDGQRNVQNSTGQKLYYQLYADSTYQQNIGANQPISLTSPHDGGSIRLPIYAKLQLTGTTPPSLYSDTLIVTIEW